MLDQAVDTTTSGGRALFGMLAVFAEFERDLIIDRVRAGLARARAEGKQLGRPRIHHVDLAQALELRARGYSWPMLAKALGVHVMAVRRALGGLSNPRRQLPRKYLPPRPPVNDIRAGVTYGWFGPGKWRERTFGDATRSLKGNVSTGMGAPHSSKELADMALLF